MGEFREFDTGRIKTDWLGIIGTVIFGLIVFGLWYAIMDGIISGSVEVYQQVSAVNQIITAK
jgi:hypothetical protein